MVDGDHSRTLNPQLSTLNQDPPGLIGPKRCDTMNTIGLRVAGGCSFPLIFPGTGRAGGLFHKEALTGSLHLYSTSIVLYISLAVNSTSSNLSTIFNSRKNRDMALRNRLQERSARASIFLAKSTRKPYFRTRKERIPTKQSHSPSHPLTHSPSSLNQKTLTASPHHPLTSSPSLTPTRRYVIITASTR